jgi:hypothetical protein
VSISMIDRVEFKAPGAGAKASALRMTVGGPLKLDKESTYEPPVTIKFVIIQGPKRAPGAKDEGHDPAEDQRVRGVVNVDPITDRWEATVLIDKAKFRSGEARGIAVAVMEKAGEYAFETLNWCDFVKLPELKEGKVSKLTLSSGGTGAKTLRKWVP